MPSATWPRSVQEPGCVAVAVPSWPTLGAHRPLGAVPSAESRPCRSMASESLGD